MSKRRVSLLTINSVASIFKVRSSNPIKIQILSKNFSVAAQSSDFYTYPVDNSSANCGKHNGFNSESQNSLGSGENHSGSALNPNWGFRENLENGTGENPSLQNRAFGGVYRKNEGNWQYNENGSQGAYGQSNSVCSSQNGSSSGYFTVNNEVNSSEYYGGNRNSQNTFGSYKGISNEMTQNSNDVNLHGSWNNNYTRSIEQLQHGVNNNYTGDGGLYQHQPSVGQHPQNLNVSQYQQNLNSTWFQNGTETAQASNQTTSKGDSIELSIDGDHSGGTLAELEEFCKVGKVKEAVEVLRLLEEKHVPVNLDSLVRLMHACGEAQALEEAKVVHDYVTRSMSPLKVGISNKILLMYGRCGATDLAFDVFDKMSNRNLTSWDTMIKWLAKNGHGEDAIDLFSQFKEAGLRPDAQMFLGIFSACAAVGDVNEGMLHFESMSKNYGIVPSMKHYLSIVDMLGSTGHLEEALELIEKMPTQPTVEVWETLMNLCRVHGFVELGDRCAELVEQLDPTCLNDQSKVGLIPVKASDLEKEKEKKRLANQNLLEIRSRVHEYRAGDTSHPDNDKIYALLRGLRSQMKEAGYIPETKFVLHDIDQEGKEDALLAHSERLATAQGLLTTAARAPIRIIKNLRVCGDCHNAFKIISKLVGREIIMRDAKRFHHFRDGVCSCRDYW